MSKNSEMKIIGYVRSDFPTKFGLPRQSGIADEVKARIVFEPEYRIKEAFRGIEDFSHIWIIWQFSEANRKEWSPTVRPPKLGGNKRMGVFATRSPYRPNSIAISSVRLDKVEYDKELGTILHISGADIMDNTPVLDIKPYLPYTDSHEEATSGFALLPNGRSLSVQIPQKYRDLIPQDKLAALVEILKEDPRPGYITDSRRFGFSYAGYEIEFEVEDGTLAVTSIKK